jgi:hypothetical protein
VLGAAVRGLAGRLFAREFQRGFRALELRLQFLDALGRRRILRAGRARGLLEPLDLLLRGTQLAGEGLLLLFEFAQLFLQRIGPRIPRAAGLLQVPRLLVEGLPRGAQRLRVRGEFGFQVLDPLLHLRGAVFDLLLAILQLVPGLLQLNQGIGGRDAGEDARLLFFDRGLFARDAVRQVRADRDGALLDEFAERLQIKRADRLAPARLEHPHHLQLAQVAGGKPLRAVGGKLVVGPHAPLLRPRL